MADYYIFGVPWEEFVIWFFSQPLYGKILIVAGIIAILALVITLIYYIIKGIAYLIYYILKGLYYLLKGTCIGLYKLFKAIYHAISGKPTTKAAMQMPIQQAVISVPMQPLKRTIKEVRSDATFCSECGLKFTDKMAQQLTANGHCFCVQCGSGFSLRNQVNERPVDVES